MNNKRHNRYILRAMSMVTQLGISMLVPVVLCFFFGRWLDERLGTGGFLIIFIILGILAAYRSLFVITMPLLKGEREREDEAYRRKAEGLARDHQRDCNRDDRCHCDD